MGYVVHITRAREWPRSEETPISLDEWRAAIAADPTRESDDDQTASDWAGHPDTANLPVFRWTSGRIVVERPDEHTVGKALSLAKYLHAHVVGDDGEVYEEQSFSRG